MSDVAVLPVEAPPVAAPSGTWGDVGLVGLVLIFLGALLMIPDRYTVPLAARLGIRPHQLVIVVLVIVLVVGWRSGRRLSVGRPARVAALLLFVSIASIVANREHFSEGSFLSAIRLTVTMSFFVASAVVVAAVATTARRRRLVLGAVVTLVAISALFAAQESSTQQPFRLNPTPPGLVEEHDSSAVQDDTPSTVVRNGVARPAGLAANPLEMSAVMALTAPFAVYMALSSRSLSARLWFTACSVLVALGVVLSISRTGALASAVMLAVALAMNVRRPKVLFVGLLAVVALSFAVIQLVPRSVDALVQQISKDGNEDPSLATRLQDYEELDNLLGARPWLGRGPDAISSYVARDGSGLILDNQYLLTIADTGVIGLVALLALLWSTFVTAGRRLRAEPGERGVLTAVLCATAGFTVMCATFDVLRFAQATSIFMVAVGIASSYGTGDRRGVALEVPS